MNWSQQNRLDCLYQLQEEVSPCDTIISGPCQFHASNWYFDGLTSMDTQFSVWTSLLKYFTLACGHWCVLPISHTRIGLIFHKKFHHSHQYTKYVIWTLWFPISIKVAWKKGSSTQRMTSSWSENNSTLGGLQIWHITCQLVLERQYSG